MARPQKQGLDYFPHDTDAMNDEKLEIMQLLYGNAGYAFYFKLLERIYRTSNLELDISDAETKFVLLKKLYLDEKSFEDMLQTSFKHQLFCAQSYLEKGVLTSDAIKKRAKFTLEKRNKMQQTYIKSGVGVSDAETIQKLGRNLAETMSETRQSKVKESKVKESKVKNKLSDYVTMTDIEFQKLVEQFGEEYTRLCIHELDTYKGASGKTYKSDYMAILSWVTKRVDENLARQVKPTNSQRKPTERPQMQVAHHESTPMTQEELKQALELAKRLDSFKT